MVKSSTWLQIKKEGTFLETQSILKKSHLKLNDFFMKFVKVLG